MARDLLTVLSIPMRHQKTIMPESCQNHALLLLRSNGRVKNQVLAWVFLVCPVVPASQNISLLFPRILNGRHLNSEVWYQPLSLSILGNLHIFGLQPVGNKSSASSAHSSTICPSSLGTTQRISPRCKCQENLRVAIKSPDDDPFLSWGNGPGSTRVE